MALETNYPLGPLDFPTTGSGPGGALAPGDTHTQGGVEYTYQPWGAWKADSDATGGGSIEVGPTPPTSPSEGDLWWNTLESEGILYVWYDSAAAWVQTVPTGGVAGGGGGNEVDPIPDWDTSGWPADHPGIPGYGVVFNKNGIGFLKTDAHQGYASLYDVSWRTSPVWKDPLETSLESNSSGMAMSGSVQSCVFQTPKNFKGKSLVITYPKDSWAGNQRLYFNNSGILVLGTETVVGGTNNCAIRVYGPLPDGYVCALSATDSASKVNITQYEFI